MILKKATAPYVLLALLAMSGSANAVITGPGMQVENLNRGAVAIKAPSGVFVSWRQLAGDPAGTTFNVYRGAARLNAAPLATLNFTDSAGTAADSYTVRAIVGGANIDAPTALTPCNQRARLTPVRGAPELPATQ